MRRFRVLTLRLSLVAAVLAALYVHAFAQGNCTGAQIFSSSNCRGDEISAEEKNLIEIVNKYRVANGQSELRASTSLSMVANRRMLDLKQNLKTLTHSWSNCPYELSDKKTWKCLENSPERLNSGYKGQGYETLYRTSKGRATPVAALDAWKKSSLHNSIILNGGIFKDMNWEEFGVAIDGEFAAMWFGSKGSGGKPSGLGAEGLGVSFDQTVKGLSKLLDIDQTSSTVESNHWQGFSADKKIKLEISGTRKEVSETNLGVTVKLDANKTLDPKSKSAISTLLRNIFPEWPDRDAWVDSSVAAIAVDKSVVRTKLVRKIAIEMRSDGQNSLKLFISPESKPRYVEIN